MPRTNPADIQRLLDYCIENDDPRAVKEIFKVNETGDDFFGSLLNFFFAVDHQGPQDGSKVLYKRCEISTGSRRIQRS